MPKNFVLLGLAGYVAPKHLKAIKEVGGNLIAACDPHDSVGVIDSYFPECQFFTEFERFSRHCEELIYDGGKIDYVVICSPNYLHMAHCMFALRIGADAICEKPVVLNTRNLDKLIAMEKTSKNKIYPILQTRLHPKIIELKKWYACIDKPVKGRLVYNAPRGDWYKYSWKWDIKKSGGIGTNIGIHLIDLLAYMFGKDWRSLLIVKDPDLIEGTFSAPFAVIDFSLSIHRNSPQKRILQIEDKEIDFTKGFADLHPASYKAILAGNGFNLADTRTSILLCENIRYGIPGTAFRVCG